MRNSRRLLATRPSDPPSILTFEEALRKLEKGPLRPGQDVIDRAKVMRIVRGWDPLRARSAVASSGTRRVQVDGHHTTIAATMLDSWGPFMGEQVGVIPPGTAEISWLPHRAFGLGGPAPMRIIDSASPLASRVRAPRASHPGRPPCRRATVPARPGGRWPVLGDVLARPVGAVSGLA